jgi:hypothetical protein
MSDLMPVGLLLELLPRDLCAELCIADVTVQDHGRALRFRLDPGRAFERSGSIEDAGGEWYNVGIRERYRPGDRLEYISGSSGMSAVEVPDELRGAAGRAYSRTAALPHWRDAFRVAVPKAVGTWQDTTPRGIAVMTRDIARMARTDGCALFVYAGKDCYECATVPPAGVESFLSVTRRGHWSIHCLADTYPVDGWPGAAECASLAPAVASGLQRTRGLGEIQPQVDLARLDLAAGEFQGNLRPVVPPSERASTGPTGPAGDASRSKTGRTP